MTRIRDTTVLVTGGAGGLGRGFAEACLAAAARRVVLWDVDERSLERTAAELQAQGHTVHAEAVDVSDPSQIEETARRLVEDLGPPDVLCNNAGIVVGKVFQEHTRGEIEKTVAVNVLGPMHVARAFLPAMIRRGTGHIVNVSSAAGYIPNPRMSVYAASKWAVLGWSESLRLELRQAGVGLRVTTVAPGYVDTGMFEGVRAPLLTPILEPERLVREMIRAIERNKIVLRTPFMVRVLPFLRGVLPSRIFDQLAGRVFGVYTTMETFVGRAPGPGRPGPLQR